MSGAIRGGLEAAVEKLREGSAKSRGDASAPNAIRRDRLYARILGILSPRIRSLTRQYAMQDMAEDAWQACALGVHRAIATYDPDRASFSTHVTWAMRGELQSLRHRVRLDQRDSARSAGARTVSLDGMAGSGDPHGAALVDQDADIEVEGPAATHMAYRWIWNLLERSLPPHQQSDGPLALAYWTGTETPRDLTREQHRLVARRVARHCRAIATQTGCELRLA